VCVLCVGRMYTHTRIDNFLYGSSLSSHKKRPSHANHPETRKLCLKNNPILVGLFGQRLLTSVQAYELLPKLVNRRYAKVHVVCFFSFCTKSEIEKQKREETQRACSFSAHVQPSSAATGAAKGGASKPKTTEGRIPTLPEKGGTGKGAAAKVGAVKSGAAVKMGATKGGAVSARYVFTRL